MLSRHDASEPCPQGAADRACQGPQTDSRPCILLPDQAETTWETDRAANLMAMLDASMLALWPDDAGPVRDAVNKVANPDTRIGKTGAILVLGGGPLQTSNEGLIKGQPQVISKGDPGPHIGPGSPVLVQPPVASSWGDKNSDQGGNAQHNRKPHKEQDDPRPLIRLPRPRTLGPHVERAASEHSETRE